MALDYHRYMERAIELARNGMGMVSPNPMVGAVIVARDGTILGEGWHRKFGLAHAEVNAFNSVKPEQEHRLAEATMFVTLEPCAHHGKTPPCADLIVEKKVKSVVVGARDPFHRVDGRGIERLREAGIDVAVGIMEKECVELNKTFFFAHTHGRPYVTLKWAQSADGWTDSRSTHPYRFSSPLSQTLVHRLRSLNDAIITSTATATADNPRLDTRLTPGARTPVPVVMGRSDITKATNLRANPRLLRFEWHDIEATLVALYREHNVTSVLVEAGPTLLQTFIDSQLWNEARVEVNPVRLGADGIHKAPVLPAVPHSCETIENNTVYYYRNE